MTASGGGGSGGLRRRLRSGFLRLLNRSLNRVTVRLARAGRGPFSLVVHTGRKSGREYQTPLLLATLPEGFVAELTYGPQVDWLRNVEAAGQCTVIHGGRAHHVSGVEPCGVERGRGAFGLPARVVLTLLRKKHYRILRTEPSEPTGRG